MGWVFDSPGKYGASVLSRRSFSSHHNLRQAYQCKLSEKVFSLENNRGLP